MTNETRFQHDASGQGHCWEAMIAEDHPASIIDELETWEIEDSPAEGDEFTASSGLLYRLA